MSKVDWNGEGLPPAGVECEFSLNRGTVAWVKGVVIGADGAHMVVLRHRGEYHARNKHSVRPIRTPEQIAAEERVKAAQEWLKGIEREYGVDVADKCEAILLEAESRWKHDNHKPDFPKSEVQASSEVHQDNRELAEQQRGELLQELEKLVTIVDFTGLEGEEIRIRDIIARIKGAQP